MSWTVTLPYLRPPLSLNDRYQTPAGRAVHSATVRRIRADVALLIRNAKIPPQESVHVRLHYRPKDNRRRDADNLIATQKPCVDALVDAGVVPDDCAPYVDWSRPVIHEAEKSHGAVLWLVIEERT